MKSKLSIASTLQGQRLVGRFCDVTFKVGNGTVSAHRCVLAGASDYFDRLLCGHFRENEEQEFDMSGLFSSTVPLRFVIDFIYGVEVELSEEFLTEILNASKYFLLDELTEECVSFLNQNLTLRSSLWTWALADLYDLKDLYRTSKHVAMSRFYDVLKNTEEALCVPPHVLVRLFEDGLAQHCTFKEWDEFLNVWALEGDTDEHFNIMNKLKSRHRQKEDVVGKCLPRRFTELVERKRSQESSLVHRNYNQETKSSGGACNDETAEARELERHTKNTYVKSEITDTSEEAKVNSDPGCQGEVTEEVLICRRPGECIMYRPFSNKWLYSEEIDSISSERYMLYGIGKTDFYMFRKSYRGGVLVDIKDGKKVYVDPPEGLQDVHFFSAEGDLFCAGYEYRINRQRKRYCIYRYLLSQVSQSPWKEVCTSFFLLEKTKMETFVVQDRLGDVYFLIEVSKYVKRSLKKGALLYIFRPRIDSINMIPIQSSRYKDMEYSSPVSMKKTSNGFIFFFDNNKTLQYTESSKELEVRDSEPLPTAFPGVYDLRRQCYIGTFDTEILSPHQKQDGFIYNCLYAYKREDRTLYTVPPPPTKHEDYKINCQLVPSIFLDQLKEKPCESITDFLLHQPPPRREQSTGITLEKGVDLNIVRALLNMNNFYDDTYYIEDSDDDYYAYHDDYDNYWYDSD